MNIIDKVIEIVSPERALRRQAARQALKILSSGYSNHGASRTKKSLVGWNYRGGSPDDDITDNLDILRQRSRDLYMGAPLATGSKVVERLGYQTHTYKAPMLSPKLPTTAEQLLKRLPGEPLYSGMSPEDRAAEQLGRDLAELDEIITRREEWMCAQALFNGQIHIVGEGVDEIIDFQLTNREALAGTALWSDANSNPLADLKRFGMSCLNGE